MVTRLDKAGIIATGSTTERSLEDRFGLGSGLMDIRDFGFTGFDDSTIDFTPTWNAMLEAVADYQDPGPNGGRPTVYFPAGHYYFLTKPDAITTRLALQGATSSTTFTKKYSNTGGATEGFIRFAPGSSGSDMYNIGFQHSTLEQNAGAAISIYSDGAAETSTADHRFSGVTVTASSTGETGTEDSTDPSTWWYNYWDYCMYADGSESDNGLRGLWIENCNAFFTGKTGLYFDSCCHLNVRGVSVQVHPTWTETGESDSVVITSTYNAANPGDYNGFVSSGMSVDLTSANGRIVIADPTTSLSDYGGTEDTDPVVSNGTIRIHGVGSQDKHNKVLIGPRVKDLTIITSGDVDWIKSSTGAAGGDRVVMNNEYEYPILTEKTGSALYDYGIDSYSTDIGGDISVLTPLGLRETPKTFASDDASNISYTGDPGQIILEDNETATFGFSNNGLMALVTDGSGYSALMAFSYKQAITGSVTGVAHDGGLTIATTDTGAGWQCTKDADSRSIVFTNRTGATGQLNIATFGGRIKSLVIA